MTIACSKEATVAASLVQRLPSPHPGRIQSMHCRSRNQRSNGMLVTACWTRITQAEHGNDEDTWFAGKLCHAWPSLVGPVCLWVCLCGVVLSSVPFSNLPLHSPTLSPRPNLRAFSQRLQLFIPLRSRCWTSVLSVAGEFQCIRVLDAQPFESTISLNVMLV